MTLSSSVFPSAKAAVNSGISRFRPYASTRNACKVCAPLGASIAYRGIEGCIPLIHGSQGCSTYIRRYSISHFREPIDIASSNFTESSAIFGGKDNLVSAIANVTRQYHPTSIGVMSTCLSETIGEDVRMYMKNIDGFHEAILAAVSKLAVKSSVSSPLRLNLVSGFLSTEDLREFHDILSSFNIDYTLIPDYSESLDSGSWEEYQKLPSGGTKLDDIRKMGDAAATLALGRSADESHCAGSWLERTYQVPVAKMDFPIGIPLVRCGFPIHDRMGGQRILHVGYRGALALFDSICNVLMQDTQLAAASGWTYI